MKNLHSRRSSRNKRGTNVHESTSGEVKPSGRRGEVTKMLIRYSPRIFFFYRGNTHNGDSMSSHPQLKFLLKNISRGSVAREKNHLFLNSVTH